MRYLLPVLLVVLPLIAYVIWLTQARRAAAANDDEPPGARDAPWTWIAIGTLAAVCLALVVAGLFDV